MQISNPDKVLFPDDGITKADLAGYYQRMADAMVPWLRDRPAAMIRYPAPAPSHTWPVKRVSKSTRS